MAATMKRERERMATEAGSEAYCADLTAEACPHREYTPEWFAWVGGHTAAAHRGADRARGRLWTCECPACHSVRATR